MGPGFHRIKEKVQPPLPERQRTGSDPTRASGYCADRADICPTARQCPPLGRKQRIGTGCATTIAEVPERRTRISATPAARSAAIMPVRIELGTGVPLRTSEPDPTEPQSIYTRAIHAVQTLSAASST